MKLSVLLLAAGVTLVPVKVQGQEAEGWQNRLVGYNRDGTAHYIRVYCRRDGRCYRETPVTCRLDDGTLVEGTVDLAYATAAGFVVVDFKTDRAEGEVLDRYRRQVGIYADAVARATGQRVRAVLMKV